MLDRQCFQCGDLAMLPEADAKTGIVFMNFGKKCFLAFVMAAISLKMTNFADGKQL